MITRYYGKRERSKMHQVPIYGISLEVVASGSIDRSRHQPKRIKDLGPCGEVGNLCGLMSSWGNDMAIFLQFDRLSHDVIAHEVFHATHRIMEYTGVKIGKNHHEAAAHLNGYITELVYQDLKRWKLKVR